MIGKLKKLKEITVLPITHSMIHVYHSSVKKSICIKKENENDFGTIIDIKLWDNSLKGRVIYYKGKSCTSYNQLYYDEWFEWIGKKIEYIPDELWNIEDL